MTTFIIVAALLAGCVFGGCKHVSEGHFYQEHLKPTIVSVGAGVKAHVDLLHEQLPVTQPIDNEEFLDDDKGEN